MAGKLLFKKTADGSIKDQNGRILLYSVERFKKDICYGDHCFICGKSKKDTSFNNEHIFPKWLLRQYNLFNSYLILANGSEVRYDKYVIPCCTDCNKLMGRLIEQPVRELITDGSKAITKYLNEVNPWLFQIWLSLIYFKTHYKDRSYRFNVDQRKRDGMIAEVYDWETLHHIHCIARSFYTNPVIDTKVFSTFIVLPCLLEPGLDEFDFGFAKG